jgi:hypothetical protein
MNFRQPDVSIRSSSDVPKQMYLCIETLKNRLAGWSRHRIYTRPEVSLRCVLAWVPMKNFRVLQDGVIWWRIFTSANVKFRTKYRLSDASGLVSFLWSRHLLSSFASKLLGLHHVQYAERPRHFLATIAWTPNAQEYLHQNSNNILIGRYQLCFKTVNLKKGNVGPLVFIWSCKPQIDVWLWVLHCHFLVKHQC